MTTVGLSTTDTKPRRPGRDNAGAAARVGQHHADLTSGFILVLVLAFNLFGLVMVLSASSVAAIQEDNSASWYFSRQVVWVAAGAVVFFVASSIGYHFWGRVARPAYYLTYALLGLVFLMGLEGGGSARWLAFGPMRMQPSELAKLTVIVFVAKLLSDRERHIGDRRRSLHPVLVWFLPLALLVFVEPDLGTTIILGCIVMSMLFAAGVPLLPLATLTAIGASGAVVAAIVAPYRRRRLLAFTDPWSDASDTGWQTLQSLTGLANGGLDGMGLGQSRVKWGYLPNSHTDFIFAIIGEELGLIGTMTILLLVFFFALLGFRTALHAPDLFGQLLAAGITAWFCIQAFVNIGGVVGLLPITGVTLPFVSFGGSSLIVNMAAAGILLNISREVGARAGQS